VFEHIHRRRDYYAGALMSLIGAGTVVQSSRYDIGSLQAVGPGFFPLVMGVILVFAGALIALNQEGGELDHPELAVPEWRGWGCIIGGVLAFMLIAPRAGMFPATFACVFVAAMGDRTTRLRSAATLAAIVATVGVLLFYYGLHVQIRPFGA
jgi:hypothetical protein